MNRRLVGLIALIAVATGGLAGAMVLSRQIQSGQAAVERAKEAISSQTRSLDGMRERHEAHENERLYDIGYEACGSYDISTLARRLGVAPRPSVVAVAFAGAIRWTSARDFGPGAWPRCGTAEAA